MPKIKIRLPERRQRNDRGPASEAPLERGIYFLNTTGEEIPAYGVFQGHDTRNEQYMPAIVIAKKPIDGTANASAIFVNGPFAVPNNDFGFAQDGPLYQVLTDGTATAGEGLGLTDDSFEASPGSGPFVAIGEDDVLDDIYLCLLQAGGGGIKYAYPPSGGLPAASYNATTEKLTPGSSNCELAELSGGVYQRSGSSVVVENPVGAAVGTSGKPMTIGETAYGKWTVLVEDCTGTTSEDPGGGGGPNPEPPVPDAIDSGTSKGIDMGYSMGV